MSKRRRPTARQRMLEYLADDEVAHGTVRPPTTATELGFLAPTDEDRAWAAKSRREPNAPPAVHQMEEDFPGIGAALPPFWRFMDEKGYPQNLIEALTAPFVDGYTYGSEDRTLGKPSAHQAMFPDLLACAIRKSAGTKHSGVRTITITAFLLGYDVGFAIGSMRSPEDDAVRERVRATSSGPWDGPLQAYEATRRNEGMFR